jgi:hypothetical protein
LFKLWSVATPSHWYLFGSWFGNAAQPAVGILMLIHQHETFAFGDSSHNTNQLYLAEMISRFSDQIIDTYNSNSILRLLILSANAVCEKSE